jgi:hypothetical protein
MYVLKFTMTIGVFTAFNPFTLELSIKQMV